MAINNEKKYDIFFSMNKLQIVHLHIYKVLTEIKKMLFDLKTLLTNSKDKESWYSNKVFLCDLLGMVQGCLLYQLFTKMQYLLLLPDFPLSMFMMKK